MSSDLYTELFSKVKASPARNVINALLFYVGWTICAFSGAEGEPMRGMVLGLFIFSFHLFVLSRNAKHELLLGCTAVSIGIVIEFVLMNTVLMYRTPNPWALTVAPLWILTDYLLFATTLNNCLSLLKKSILLQVILGAIGGAVSYYIGLKINAVHFTVDAFAALTMIATVWAFLLPILFFVNDKLEALIEENSMVKGVLDWLVWYFPIYAVQFFSAWVTLWNVTSWYPTLVKAPWSPPNWLFGPVWTLLYILMAFGIWLVSRSNAPNSLKRKCVLIFFVQLAFNAAWSYLFFGIKEPAIAFVDLAILCCLVVYLIYTFWKASRLAGFMQVPYLLWGLYALSLNAAIWWLN